MTTKTHMWIILPIVALIGSFLLVTAWATKRRDYTPCHNAVEDIRRASSMDDARRVLERHGLPVLQSENGLTAICRGTGTFPVLRYYPVMAVYVEVETDNRQRVTEINVDDVVVINGLGR